MSSEKKWEKKIEISPRKKKTLLKLLLRTQRAGITKKSQQNEMETNEFKRTRWAKTPDVC